MSAGKPEAPHRAAFDPKLVGIVRKRFSTPQGEVEVFYDGRRLEQYGDTITLLPDGMYRGHSDAFWIGVAWDVVEGGKTPGYVRRSVPPAARVEAYATATLCPRHIPTMRACAYQDGSPCTCREVSTYGS